MVRLLRARTLKILAAIALVLVAARALSAADPNGVTIIDARHYSIVFGETRNYRIFLPPGYDIKSEKRYPVIYFFHGWSQRYFGTSTPYAEYDQGDENGGDNIANFVAGHDVIIVKVDGYNRSPDEKYYVRPWNIGPVETYRQFPLYFPELVGHVDTHYRTIADREHRAISGLSMGGFMTFWIGGKYPHLLSAAGNFCGSPEFVAGPKDFPVEYRHLDMYNNYAGMNLRLNYGDKDFIRGYHEDMNRVWPQIIDNYEYKVYDAAHTTCGMADMFAFIMKTFEKPPARPLRWDHIDVYPEFSVWDYEIMTDRTVPGFTILENVDVRGFRSSVREFLPDGSLLPYVKVTVRTPGIYEKNQMYIIHDLDIRTTNVTQRTIRSDHAGRLTIDVSGSTHEIGINKKGDKPDIVLLSADIQGSQWAVHGQDVSLSIRVFNKGLAGAKNVRATLSATRPGAQIIKDAVAIGDLAAKEIKSGVNTFSFRVPDENIEIQKFKIAFSDDRKNEWADYIELPLRKAVAEIKEFEIGDGRTLAVAKAGTDTETVLLGTGNGDGIANPGESIVILVKDQGKLWRTDVAVSDANVNPFGVNVRRSDNWGAMDHVGGSAKYDVPMIASSCPENHPLEFFVEYWLPQYPLHIIRQGIVRLRVSGNDATAPSIGRIQVTGDNVLQVRILDGARISRAKATLIREDDINKKIETSLTDDGRNGDRAAEDLVFSHKVPTQVFGIFRVIVEAEDIFGNKSVHETEDRFVVH